MPGENSQGWNTTEISDLPLVAWLTTNDSWAYVPCDQNYKTVGFLVRSLMSLAGINAGLFLNLGPAPDGQIVQVDREILMGIGEWLATNGRAIYGTRPVSQHEWGFVVQKESELFLYVLNFPGKQIILENLPISPKEAVMDGEELKISEQNGKITIAMPYRAFNPIGSVIFLR